MIPAFQSNILYIVGKRTAREFIRRRQRQRQRQRQIQIQRQIQRLRQSQSSENTKHMLYFRKAEGARISNMTFLS